MECPELKIAAAFLCVQSLHTIWRDEKSVLLQLEVLNTVGTLRIRQTFFLPSSQQTPIPHKSKPTDGRSKAICVPSMLKSYNNHGYIREDNYIGAKMPEVKTCETVSGTKRGQTQEERLFRSGDYDSAYADSYFTNGFNEFNASSFDPSVIDSRLPYLTIRKKPKNLLDPIGELANDYENMPKTHSLLDLSLDRLKNVEVVKYQNGQLTPSEADESAAESSVEKEENVTGSLDRKIIKNKNLKILKKLSPFCRKKPTDLINIYRINPPMGVARQEMLDISNIDSQLNRLYSNRGMYTFEEKTRKIVFYPPEVFNKNRMQGFRSSIQSIVSSQSQSSMDSEDIKQISDVAL
ncbi:hypothetical protein RUM43_001705 [Polyplax serrata]|uniref:Uncharacterized protein n=1 Tax=Polyplax serrata TaxID=468196 RepID=A0AAN8XQ77_POLSC